MRVKLVCVYIVPRVVLFFLFFWYTQPIYSSGADKSAIIGSMADEQVNGRALNKVDLCMPVMRRCLSPPPHPPTQSPYVKP